MAQPFGRGKDIAGFFFWAGPVSCLVSPTVGVSILTLAGIVAPGEILFNWFVWWFGDTLGVLLAPLLLLVWFMEPEKLWVGRRVSLIIPLVAALVAIILIYLVVTDTEQKRIEAEFRNSSIMLADNIRSGFTGTTGVGHTAVDFILHSGSIRVDEFHKFTGPLLKRNRQIQAISWCPLVMADERKAYVARARKDGFADYQIKERDGDGKLVRAAERAEYVPVFYIEPFSGNEAALGFDLASEPKRLQAL